MAWAITKGAPKTWLITDGDKVVGSIVQNERRRYSVKISGPDGAMDYQFRCSTLDAARAYAFGVEAGQKATLTVRSELAGAP